AASRNAYILTVPPEPPSTSRDDWKNIGTSLMESVHGGGISPAIKEYAAMVTAFRQDEPAEFNQAVQDYRLWLGDRFVPELKKGARESFFNHFQPFYKATVIYVLALVLGCSFWFNWSEMLRRSALYLMVLA